MAAKGIPLNGTLGDEVEVLKVCLGEIGVGPKQVVHTHTGLGNIVRRSDDGDAALKTYLRAGMKGLKLQTVDDFFKKTEHPLDVSPSFSLGGALVSVSRDRIRRIFRDHDGWDRFRKKFPDSSGRLEFSRVGFSRDLRQALIYVGIQRDWTAGYGGFWFYRRLRGRWVASGSAMAWIS
jgi:hypothetical protein